MVRLKKETINPHRAIWLKKRRSCAAKLSFSHAALVSYSPSDTELNVGIKEGNDWGGSNPPPTHSGPDQTLLLVVPHHLYESWMLAVSLRHKIMKFLL